MAGRETRICVMPPSAVCARTRTREIVRETVATALPPPRTSVKLTHPDRVYWPDAGVTKEGLAHYYAEVWRHMAPFIVGRPLALVRCPQGISGQCFFQKHAWQGLSRSIQLARDPKDPGSAARDQRPRRPDRPGPGRCPGDPSLGCFAANLEQPDMIIMDLDPGEAVSWPEVIAAALEVRERLAALGLPASSRPRAARSARRGAGIQAVLAGGESPRQEYRGRHGGR